MEQNNFNQMQTAIEKYMRIQEHIAKEHLKSLSEAELSQLFNDIPENQRTTETLLQKLLQSQSHGAYQLDEQKSALFQRLINGKKPLIFAPPKSFSYPDYSLIENSDPIEIPTFEQESITDAIQLNDSIIPYKHILINQSVWRVLQKKSTTEAIITYEPWDSLGFTWKIFQTVIPVANSTKSIISHHNRSIPEISTYEELFEETTYQAHNYFDQIKIALNPEFEKEIKKKYDKLYGDYFAQSLTDSAKEIGKQLLTQRRKNNLPDLPDEKELKSFVIHQIQDLYLSKEYKLDEKGNLLVKSWMIQRITPTELNEAHYLNI